jgi:tetratricopeptide (TPR) repeat protein
MSYARRAMTLIESTPGADLFPLITPLNILSNIHREQGQLQEAERLLVRALSIWVLRVQADEAVASSFSPDWEQDAMEHSTELLLQQALALWAQNPHHRHCTIGRVVTALCHVYQKQQRYTEAEALLLLALPLGEEALGMHHMRATPWSILANVYKEQGRLDEANQCYSQALRISEQTLGPQHPRTMAIRIASTALLQCMARDQSDIPS